MRWIARAPTWKELIKLRERLEGCFEYDLTISTVIIYADRKTRRAAALATSCQMKITFGQNIYEVRQNHALGLSTSGV